MQAAALGRLQISLKNRPAISVTLWQLVIADRLNAYGLRGVRHRLNYGVIGLHDKTKGRQAV